ncbi:class I SAM-dependent methyltransferase [Mesorhizobium sp. M1406]|uniref:class I SAM-dependent methyltransferase n=1 Tax=Mesorhizobium sp. M1406 TaxID=2957099 RepID=UPI003339F5F3
MPSDQELFAKGLAAYQKVVSLNYMAHKEVYDILRQVLLTEAPDQFVFLDVACGTATASAEALKGSNVGRYIGIDISQPSLDVARKALSDLRCPVDLRCQDFVDAFDAWDEPVDVVWIGQSLHHLRYPSEKQALMQRVRSVLPCTGLLLIWEPTCLEGEDREGWFERFELLRPEWSMVTDEEFAAFDSHCRASDYAETSATWMAMGREAGFERVDELLTVPNQLARVYRYSH